MKTRLNKLQSIADEIMKKWIVLHARTALMDKALRGRRVIQRHNRQGKIFGFDNVRMSLVDTVLLMSANILRGGKKEASLSNLVPILADPNSATYKSVKKAFSSPRQFNWGGGDNSLSEKDKKEIARYFQEDERKRKEKDFDRIAKLVCRKYKKMEKVSDKLKGIRDKVIAHFEMRLDQGKRKLFNVKDFGLTVGEMLKCIRDIEDLALKTTLLFCNTSWILEDTKKLHRQEAIRFWGR